MRFFRSLKFLDCLLGHVLFALASRRASLAAVVFVTAPALKLGLPLALLHALSGLVGAAGRHVIGGFGARQGAPIAP